MILRIKPRPNPNIKAAIAKSMPRIQNKSFTVNNQIIPSKSREKITPGNLTKPQEKISSTISPIKLFFRHKQPTNVNDPIADAIPSNI